MTESKSDVRFTVVCTVNGLIGPRTIEVTADAKAPLAEIREKVNERLQPFEVKVKRILSIVQVA